MNERLFIDQLERTVRVASNPKRIISLVPSQTELLFHLGLDTEIIGITKFCTRPADKVNNTTKIGGTKHLDIQMIKSLQPDLIIGNKEENDQSQIEALTHELPVWMSDIADLNDALAMILKIGELTNKTDAATQLVRQIKNNFSTLLPTSPGLRIAYLIWQKPYMVAGSRTFINDMLTRNGWANVFEQLRYPEITEHDLIQASPDVIMLSSEPFPFRDKHVQAFKKICPRSRVILVDGEMFSWYGSRMLLAADYFKKLLIQLSS